MAVLCGTERTSRVASAISVDSGRSEVSRAGACGRRVMVVRRPPTATPRPARPTLQAASTARRSAPTTASLAGFALAGGGTNFSVNGAGSGRSDLFQAGAFVRHDAGAAKTMIERTEERFGLKPERLAADSSEKLVRL